MERYDHNFQYYRDLLALKDLFRITHTGLYHDKKLLVVPKLEVDDA